MDLLEKSRNTLELPAVLEMLAGEAVSEPAKAEALALVPSVHRAEVERLLAETSAAKDMMVYKGSPSLSGLRDVRGSLARADMGGVLNTRELLEIAGVLQSARAVRFYGMSAEKETCIDHLFKMLQTNRFLEDKIVNSIPGEDEIADSASSELSDIRRKMRAAAARVRDSLQKIISAPSMAKFLQDPIITTRSDRYVVPVKAECKGSVPGLVHDVSASGATLFVEPMAAVKANNEIRELKAKEKAEIERILAELSAECAAHREDIDADFSALVRLDGIFARAKLSFKLNAGAPELSERGVRLGIVTSRTRAEMDMNAIGPYLPLFQAVVSADMVSHPKPHPEPLETCLSLLGVPREEALYVGDSLPDRGCSAGAGVDFALGLWGTRHPEMEATYKLGCPEELLELAGCPCDQFIRGR